MIEILDDLFSRVPSPPCSEDISQENVKLHKVTRKFDLKRLDSRACERVIEELGCDLPVISGITLEGCLCSVVSRIIT